MHWGHAVSRDLVAWEEWPIALAPDELGTIYSGSASLADDGKIVACFTHHSENGEAQSLAFSGDGGRNFEKFAGNPVLTSDSKDFRDPKIWKMGQSWKMIVAAGRVAQIFSSPDLVSWTLESEFPAPHDEWIWECPDLFLLDGKWVLLASFVVPSAPHEALFWLGEFDGKRFSPGSEPQKLSFGPDDYAAVSFNNAPDGRRILIGWMSNWAYAAKTPTENDGFRGAMTLPRELSIRDGKLCQNPVREIEKYRGAPVDLSGAVISTNPENAPFRHSISGACDVELEIETGFNDALELDFFFGAPQKIAEKNVWPEDRDLSLFLENHRGAYRARLDREGFGRAEQFAPRWAYEAFGAKRETFKVRVLVDNCSLEIFLDNEHYGAFLVFPDAPLCAIGLSQTWFAEDVEQTTKIVSGKIYPLEF